jgi:hypothetical protein
VTIAGAAVGFGPSTVIVGIELQKGAAKVDTVPGLQTGQGGVTSSEASVGTGASVVVDIALQFATIVAGAGPA